MSRKTKWEWIIVKPGVLALSGTEFQVKREDIYTENGRLISSNVYCIYENGNLKTWQLTLFSAKSNAELLAQELIDIGLLDMDE